MAYLFIPFPIQISGRLHSWLVLHVEDVVFDPTITSYVSLPHPFSDLLFTFVL